MYKNEGLASPPALDTADPKFVPPASSKPAMSSYKLILVPVRYAFNSPKVTFFGRTLSSYGWEF